MENNDNATNLELAKKDPAIAKFAILEKALPAIRDAITANLKDGRLTPRDLERIRIPSGGGTVFSVPTFEGDVAKKELVGVLIDYRDTRAYWEVPLEQGDGNSPPSCYSLDCVTGIGSPGGSCAACPYSKFGSDGEAQACKQIRELFLLLGDSLLPVVIPLPPSSLKNSRQYFVRLASWGIPLYGIETVIGLEKAKNSKGIVYPRGTFAPGRLLEPDEVKKMKAYSELLKPLIDVCPLTSADAARPDHDLI